MAPALSLSACPTQTKCPSTFRASSNSTDTCGACRCLLDSAENCSAHQIHQTPPEPFIALTLAVSEGLHACLRVPACNSVTPFWTHLALIPAHTRPHLCMAWAHYQQQHCVCQEAKLIKSPISGKQQTPHSTLVLSSVPVTMCDWKSEAK